MGRCNRQQLLEKQKYIKRDDKKFQDFIRRENAEAAKKQREKER